MTFRQEGHLGREREIKVPKDPGFQTWLMRGGTEQREFLPRCWQEELGRGGDKRVHATHAEKGKTQKLVWSVKSNVTKSPSSPKWEKSYQSTFFQRCPRCLKLRPHFFFLWHLQVRSASYHIHGDSGS